MFKLGDFLLFIFIIFAISISNYDFPKDVGIKQLVNCAWHGNEYCPTKKEEE